ncbi:class I SAM-dependent methyltransferase [Nocardioides sp. zg-579]|uniref:Class I SAM-dependent methyltransferase n=1 Tax=Nocardioides marmotae TaxID=2663857 RepID=A0A6I3JBT0_9ACTN|nr:class I SAM-dependent methyltransferase [Nocardioides marmotae]MCR6031938.1 class I SAM-dependent methyltransferase [Gordonia jinghuaiqii]MTB95578.1 class I SAM-dependent methyltransferase [Nocardioides marmotae]QKE00998.1 class I SAM-dependent methyltransferase [Nocardioides marmotae]
MRRHDLLARLHGLLQPRSYLEVGVSTGASMALSRTRSIGVDPFFTVKHELRCDLHLVRTTSDEFFAREAPLEHLDEPQVDLAFVDGMHLAEYALRDVINLERYTHPASVLVLDDMLPPHPDVAARERALGRARGMWTGDVYKVLPVLRRHRPDLICLEVDTKPTGVLVVLGLDARSRVLLEAYDDLVPELVTSDPQHVPAEVLGRTRAFDAERLLALPLWRGLRELQGAEPERARSRVRELVRASGLDQPATVG